MSDYCEICGDELDEDELEEGICKRCKKANEVNDNYIPDENYIDPGIT